MRPYNYLQMGNGVNPRLMAQDREQQVLSLKMEIWMIL